MWGKTFITHLEGEFKTDKLRDKHVFHDASLRVNDPEEFRLTCVDYLRGLDFIVDANEMTEFEGDDEFSKFFRSGRLKPLKNIIKARRRTNIGSRYPLIWRLLLLTGIISLIGYFMPYEELNKDLLFYITTISIILSGVLYLIKKVILSSVWIKMIGVYDVEDMKSDVRVIISADTNESDLRVFDKLRDDISEFYELISRRYMKKADETTMIKPVTKTKSDELITRLSGINSELKELRTKFINGKISEDLFKKLNATLEADKDKIETVIDFFSA
ncbi:MAG TPA: hypothetical protein VI790_00510 [Candidatus Nanoarchaeia archaeon]|nr:hypothetical protein [Candidatus Nanoarchaeia archaeon]